jgi:hypothetical protein
MTYMPQRLQNMAVRPADGNPNYVKMKQQHWVEKPPIFKQSLVNLKNK